MDYAHITQEKLLALVGEFILEKNPPYRDETMRPHQERNIADVITLLPQLTEGIDVNVRFKGIDDFEVQPEILVFDLVDVPLVHGWLLDPGDKAEDVVAPLSYNQLVERVIRQSELLHNEKMEKERCEKEEKQEEEEETQEEEEKNQMEEEKCQEEKEEGQIEEEKCQKEKGNRPSTEERERILREGSMVEDWLRRTASQLTVHGLMELHRLLDEQQLAVLFRNNHFSTLFKYKGDLFVLVTDLGYLAEPKVLWEKLNQIDGDSSFCTSDFSVYHPSLDTPRPLYPPRLQPDPSLPTFTPRTVKQALCSAQEVGDESLALQLHREEVAAQEARLARLAREAREAQEARTKIEEQRERPIPGPRPQPKRGPRPNAPHFNNPSDRYRAQGAQLAELDRERQARRSHPQPPPNDGNPVDSQRVNQTFLDEQQRMLTHYNRAQQEQQQQPPKGDSCSLL